MGPGDCRGGVRCPAREELRAFVVGKLAADRLEQVATHLEGCSTCGSALREIPDEEDGLIAGLRHCDGGQETPRALPTARTPWEPGALPAGPVGDYEILAEVGRGGMGIVYQARQGRPGRLVALKVLRGGELASVAEVARFRREAEALAGLQHPNIVQVIEVGEHNGLPFIALEYCPGGSLKEKLGGTPLPPDRAAALAETLALAVHAAHRARVLHRDLKPGNVLLVPGDPAHGVVLGGPGEVACYLPKVSDFGLARRLEETGQTRDGAVLGTPSYMAPEQAQGKTKEVGPAADVYALGAVLYELLTGRPPFKGATDLDTRAQVIADEPVPVRRLQPGVPRDLETVCLKCLQKEPARRYASAEALAKDLRRFRAGEPVQARPLGRLGRLARWCRRNPSLATAAGLAVFLLAATAAVSAGWAVHASRQAGALQGALNESQEARRRTQQELAEGHFERALTECEQGEVGLGLLWLARSLETAPAGADPLAEALRANLAAWHCRQFPLTGCREEVGPILAFEPGGRAAWVAGPDRAVFRRLLATGEAAGRLPVPPGTEVLAVAAGPQGEVVLAATGRVVRLWKVSGGEPGAPFSPPGALDAIALSPDGRVALTADHAGPSDDTRTTLRRWDAHTGQPLGPTFQAAGRLAALALSPDGRTLLGAQAAGGAVLSWEVATGKPHGPLPLPRGRYQALACAPDGRAVLTGSEDQTARLWDVATGRPLSPTFHHRGPVSAVAFGPDGRTLLTADTRHTVRTWAVAPGPRPAAVLGHPRPVRSVAFGHDGRTAATGGFDGKACLWDTGPGGGVKELPYEFAVTAVLFSPDGRTLLTAAWPRSARLWDTASGRPRGKPLRHGKWVTGLAFSPDSKLVATGSFDRTATVWEAATGERRVTLRHGAGVAAVAFDPAGSRLVTGSEDGTVQIWDVATGQPSGPRVQHPQAIWAVAFSPDGGRVLTAAADGTACLWDAATGELVAPPLRHAGAVFRAAFSPDGRQILTSSWDGTARLWDATTGWPWGRPLMHADQVRAAAFGPRGRRVATGSFDGTARLWDAAGGRPLGPPLPHGDKVWAVAIDRGGGLILTGSEDGQARLWRVPPPLAASVERLTLWAQVVSGMELDAERGMHVLDAAAWRGRRQRLEALGGPPAP
jgi:WD40 repeat protein